MSDTVQPTLAFHGAAGCVTGFCAELHAGESRVLVDCGMFQGSKTLKALNYEAFPFDAAKIDAVLLTHAHIDHSGMLPKLMKAGFTGPIYATAATRDLCAVMLADAGGIQESEVRHLNRRNEQRGRRPVAPIYTEKDALAVMAQFRKVKFNQPETITPDITALWTPAGHILGAASITVDLIGSKPPQRLLFSGDLGPGGSEFTPEPTAPCGVDHLILESTYGNRERERLDPVRRRQALAAELTAAHAAGGPLLLPAFAVERTQELLTDLMAIMDSGEAPAGDIFLDSPLAIEATEVFLERGWNADLERNPFETVRPSGRLRFLPKPWESDSLERLDGWHVIMAASGMCDAGRIRRHLKRLLWRREATVLLTGYQAAGTLGRLLHEGADRVTIQGEEIRVKARVRMLDVYSGHADAQGLAAWASARQPVAGSVFLAHGEPDAVEGLRTRLETAGFGPTQMKAPQIDDVYSLFSQGAEIVEGVDHRIGAGRAAKLDWHNDRASLMIALNQALDVAPDDAAREAIIAKLQAALPTGG
jgi:metallo-beta-lactamase family protein